MRASAYSLLMLAGIIGGGIFWSRLARRDERLIFIYAAALGGAFAGAKLAYLAAEGWLHIGEAGMWLQFATGKSILGALLGGYGAVGLRRNRAGTRRPRAIGLPRLYRSPSRSGASGACCTDAVSGLSCRPRGTPSAIALAILDGRRCRWRWASILCARRCFTPCVGGACCRGSISTFT